MKHPEKEANVGSLLDCLVKLTVLYDRRMTPEALVSGLPLKNDELTLEFFARAAERAKLLSRVFELPFDKVQPELLPCIMRLKQDRYFVLLRIEGNSIVVFDGVETTVMELEELRSCYEGNIILVKPKAEVQEEQHADFRFKELTWLWKVVRGTWTSYAEILLASFFINLFSLAFPLFALNVYDRVVPNSATQTLWALAIGVFIVLGFDFLLKSLRTHFIDNAAYNIDAKLSAKIFEHILGIRMMKRPTSVGQIINSVQGFEAFRDFLTSLTLSAFIDFPFSLIFIVVIGVIGGKLLFVPLVFLVFILVVSIFIQAPLAKVTEKSHAASSKKQQSLIESQVGIAAIKMHNAQGAVQRKWERLAAYSANLNTRSKSLSTLAVNFSVFSQFTASLTMVIAGVYMIGNDKLTIGGLIACTILTGRALAPIAQIVGLVMRYHQAGTSVKSIDSIMKLPIDRPLEKKFFSPEKITKKVEFKHVSFSYPNMSEKALDEITLTIEPGSRVGILGRIGSGKSTLLKLAIGLYEPGEGKVFLSDYDMQDLDPHIIRQHIGYIPQDPMLFSGSLRENIALRNPNASDDEIQRVIFLSGLDQFVKQHPDGVNLEVGERGDNLSGGQRQAVAIAQGLLHNPDILVFDEPTDSMDELSEQIFKKRLEETLPGKTLILSTHKVSMLSLVETLIILDHGHIIAQGPKDKVLQALREGAAQKKASDA